MEYPNRAKNAELWELCKKEMEKHPVYKIDKIIEERGFKVLRLPPYHAELNPIELIWANVRLSPDVFNKNGRSILGLMRLS